MHYTELELPERNPHSRTSQAVAQRINHRRYIEGVRVEWCATERTLWAEILGVHHRVAEVIYYKDVVIVPVEGQDPNFHFAKVRLSTGQVHLVDLSALTVHYGYTR